MLVRPEGLARSEKDRTSTRAANRVPTGGPGTQWAPTTRGVPVPCPPGTLVRPVGRRCLSLLLAPGTAAPLGCGGTSRLERSPPGSRARGPDSQEKPSGRRRPGPRAPLRGVPALLGLFHVCFASAGNAVGGVPGPKTTSLDGRAEIVPVCLLCGVPVFGGGGESEETNVGEHSQRPGPVSGSAFQLTKLTRSR